MGFLTFLTLSLVTLDKTKCFQTLKVKAVNLGIWRFVDFRNIV